MAGESFVAADQVNRSVGGTGDMSIIAIIIGFIAFIAGWIYAINEFGFFLGVGIGWIPAFFIGFFVGLGVDLLITAIFIALAIPPLRKVYAEDLKRNPDSSKSALKRSKTRNPYRVKGPRGMPKYGTPEYFQWANREGPWAD